MIILHVVGARPNFMKVAPVIAALAGRCTQLLVHTGQHYDKNMSDVFFQQLGIPEPDINLEIGSGSHAVQTAQIMIAFEKVVLAKKPDWVVVYGDVNSTVASAVVCSKLGIPLAHVEAGLRSYDRTMPEEINRILTDRVADLLLTPSSDGNENLAAEGIDPARVKLVGNVMIDTLVRLLPQASLPAGLPERFALVTLHRPFNVDEPTMLTALWTMLNELAERIPMVFPIHPRTRARLESLGLMQGNHSDLILLEPQGYLEFLAMQQKATLVMTDSGGIQEETTYLGVPCFTLRPNTERPITITEGSNMLIGSDLQLLRKEVIAVLDGTYKKGRNPELWDGNAGKRIAAILCPLPDSGAGV